MNNNSKPKYKDNIEDKIYEATFIFKNLKNDFFKKQDI